MTSEVFFSIFSIKGLGETEFFRKKIHLLNSYDDYKLHILRKLNNKCHAKAVIMNFGINFTAHE